MSRWIFLIPLIALVLISGCVSPEGSPGLQPSPGPSIVPPAETLLSAVGVYCADVPLLSELSCTDTETGTSSTLKGNIETNYDVELQDYCGSWIELVEASCSNGIVVLEKVNCDFGCEYGVCEPAPDSPTCTDSDPAGDPYVKGKVETNYGVNLNDYCDAGEIGYVELSCVNGRVREEKRACEYGCTGGACREAPATLATCEDDDGYNPYFKGRVDTNYGVRKTDYCLNEVELVELTCSGNRAVQETIFCPFGCRDSACRCPGAG
jgi:hypothetical protein